MSDARGSGRRTLRQGTALVLVAGLAAMGCGQTVDRASATPSTKSGATSYVKRAIRSSNEGVILMPSEKAERVFELPRLNEIAQALRQPAAECFLLRAIETMEPEPKEDRGFSGVPEGQVKIRTRIAYTGEVVRTEVLETGFADTEVPSCIQKAIEAQQFPPNRSGVTHYVDVIYWVSLGMQGDVHTEEYRTHLRRESIAAGVRAKPCLRGRAAPGGYQVDGLNLVDREGKTMINRIDGSSLPSEVRSCVARALRDLRMPRQPESFVRPVSTKIDFAIAGDGAVAVAGEDWLRLLELEERAKLAERRAALGADEAGAPADVLADSAELPDAAGEQRGAHVDRGAEDPVDAAPHESTDAGVGEDPSAPAPARRPRGDPGKGGLKLDLGPRRPSSAP